MNTLELIVVLVVLVLGTALVSGFYFTHRMHKKVTYILDALEDKETNFRFNEHTLFNRSYNRTLNRIRTLFEQEKQELEEREFFYAQMMSQVRTGIVVVDLSVRREGRIVYSNASALHLLGMATFSHLRQLATISKELEQAFSEITVNGEKRCSYYNERGKLTISLTASETTLQGKQVKIVTFNDITGEMVHNEEVSWNKLIRVLTHEIMNTVTPIASLSTMLSEGVAQTKEGEAIDRNELKMGLDTIASSSNGLIKFVDSYRSLTRISAPVKKAFYVHELIEQVESLVHEQLHNAGVVLSYTEKSEDILLYADAGQLSQVLVNLVRNALQAGATKIDITAEINFAESVLVTVANNGVPISKENQEEIFVPFYTTKQEGTGIGLSLSRQIMRLHNGSIKLVHSNASGTVFLLQFH